jgi:hypothetical protein
MVVIVLFEFVTTKSNAPSDLKSAAVIPQE